MYFKLSLKAGFTTKNVADALVHLMTGGTLATAPAVVDQAGSSVVASTTAAGWTVHDAAATADGQVITANDLQGNPKYAYIGSSGANLQFYVAEAWDAVLHSGTNLTPAFNVAYDTTVAQSYYLLVTPRLFVCSKADGQGAYCGEFTREAPYLRAARTSDNSWYPSYGICNLYFHLAEAYGTTMVGSYRFLTPRAKHFTAAGDITGNATSPYCNSFHITGPFPHSAYQLAAGIRDMNDQGAFPVYPAYAAWSQNPGTPKGYGVGIGRMIDTYLVNNFSGANGDEYTDGTTTVVQFGGDCKFGFTKE